MAELLLIKAAEKGDLEAVCRLLAAGHEVDERGEPLSDGEMRAAKTMFGYGDDADGVAQSMGRTIDMTPLMAAAEQGSMDVIEVLLDAGADVNAADSLKRTAVMIAIEWKHEAVARHLLDAGADPHAKDLSGRPILSQAIGAGLFTLAHALLDAGAKANPKAKSDCLP
ncbi:MAG: ankyrin repeat domain-containing protein, partial [Planctomycetales bacterium]|nr:ankyrin repeat domain-containing protein [Planctomycetales bacterium]